MQALTTKEGKRTWIRTMAEHLHCSSGHSLRHFAHSTYLHILSLCNLSDVLPYHNHFLCPHTNIHISVTEAGAKSTFTYFIALSLLDRMPWP